MSVEFVSNLPIDYSQLKNFNFKGVWVEETDTDESILLTDGKNYLWCYLFSNPNSADLEEPNNNCGHALFTRYAFNEVENIMGAIEEYFKISFFFESDERFDEIVDKMDSY